MLAPNPSQHLESETEPLVNPSLRFSLPESCSNLDKPPSNARIRTFVKPRVGDV
jgi:hypothetical protein